jgi:hypothetical protein
VTIKPNAISRVRANRTEKIQISLFIPPTSTLGDYIGTIHLRSGSQTLPQTLKVGVSIWNAAIDVRLRFSVLFPSSWRQEVSDNGDRRFFPPGMVVDEASEYAGDIQLFVDPNPQGLSTTQYYDGLNNLALFDDAAQVQQLTISNALAFRFVTTTGLVGGDVVIIVLPGNFIRIEDRRNPAVFDQIVGTFRLF